MDKDHLLEELRFLYIQAIDNIVDLQGFFKMVDDHIRESESNEAIQIKEAADDKGVETGPGFWAEHLPYWWEQVFDVQLRSSVVMVAMSVVEWQLTIFGNWTRRSIGGVKFSGFQGTKICQLAQWFRALGVSEPADDGWDELNRHYILRNALVHIQGMIDDEEAFGIPLGSPEDRLFPTLYGDQLKILKDHIRDTEGLSLNEGCVKVSAYYCSDLIEFSKLFFGSLYRGIGERINAIEVAD